MEISQEKLNKLESITKIISAIAIPIIIAVAGWMVQSTIANEGIKKDYVQMAIGILKDADKQKDTELTSWALTILDKNSPIPFSDSLQRKITQGALATTRLSLIPKMPVPPDVLMKPPEKIRPFPKGPEISEKEILEYSLDAYGKGTRNEILARYLQDWIRLMKKNDDDFRANQSKVEHGVHGEP